MNTSGVSTCILAFCAALVTSTPFLYGNYNPYFKYLGYNVPYQNAFPNLENLHYLPPYLRYSDRIADTYLSIPDTLPTLNVLAELPYTVRNTFTVVPMLVVSRDNMKFIRKGEIMTVSKEKPEMTLKTEKDDILSCTPAVKIILDAPVIAYGLKSSIMFPSEMEIVHEGYRIPIKVGAVIAPVVHDTFVSADSPVSITVVYAVPSDPVKIDYVNNEDVIINTGSDAVIVESQEPPQPPKNVTVLEFPDAQAEPVLAVDEEDDELVNRNPPIVLAPAGIVQSTQPIHHVEPFSNSKESELLTQLREEALKRRI